LQRSWFSTHVEHERSLCKFERAKSSNIQKRSERSRRKIKALERKANQSTQARNFFLSLKISLFKCNMAFYTAQAFYRLSPECLLKYSLRLTIYYFLKYLIIFNNKLIKCILLRTFRTSFHAPYWNFVNISELLCTSMTCEPLCISLHEIHNSNYVYQFKFIKFYEWRLMKFLEFITIRDGSR
jgi:hypothetical protein